MKRRNIHCRFLFIILLFAGIFTATAQQKKPDSTKQGNYKSDTLGRKQYLIKLTADLGLSEQQALALRRGIYNNKKSIESLRRDSSLSANEKQQRINEILVQGEQLRNSLLTPEQRQKLKAILSTKRQQADRGQVLVKQNQELLEHPVKGATFKSRRTIN